jgi:hypothetical protein
LPSYVSSALINCPLIVTEPIISSTLTLISLIPITPNSYKPVDVIPFLATEKLERLMPARETQLLEFSLLPSILIKLFVKEPSI